MKIIRKVFVVILLPCILLWFLVAKSIYTFSWTWEDKDISNVKDTQSMSWTNIAFYDVNSNEYKNQNKRFYISSWVLKSQQYWDFIIDNSIVAYKSDTKNAICNQSNISYYFSWSVESEFWWEVKIIWNNNYYCPVEKVFSIPLYSDIVKNFSITSGKNLEKVTLVDSYWNNAQIPLSLVFNNQNVSINWVYNWKKVVKKWELWDSVETWEWNYFWWISIDNAKLEKVLNENIEKYTRDFPKETNNPIQTIKKMMYYNYEWWDRETTPSNEDNKWKIITIWTWWTANNFSKVEVNWENVIVIKWWNLYINSDIYNKNKSANSKDLLLIIVKRDSKDKKHWWNIYIDPKVTNIDAIIIADWSILNFDWSKVITWNDDSLRRQLLIYGSIFTKNTIWEDKSIPWTDTYIKNWETNTWTYNLENLRNFQTVLSSWVTPCNDLSNKVTAKWNSSTWALEYAFAWKKQCFADENMSGWKLRTTESFSKVVIRYNPAIANSNIKMLQINY